MMKNVNSKFSSQTLVDQFATIAVKQGIAVANDDSGEANRLFDKLVAIGNELKSRGERRLFLPLLDHTDPWVRLSAVKEIFAEAPEIARQVLAGC
jgi:hypothetical protein